MPTEGTDQVFGIQENFDANNVNYSSVLARDRKDISTVDTKPNLLYRMDGHTPHRGAFSNGYIEDRVFIRICFTPPGKEFYREGNTINPCLNYSENYWRKVPDPGSYLSNVTDFKTPEEFVNMWNIACQGHPSYGIQGSGRSSHENQLLDKLKNSRFSVQKKVQAHYANRVKFFREANCENLAEIEEIRAALLSLKLEL